MSKVKMGTVIKLFISNNITKKRLENEKLLFDLKGVIDDKFYNKDLNRSVLLTSLQSYEKVTNNNIDINYGELGENLLFSFNPQELKIGTIIHINTCVLEITKNCTICDHLSSIDESVPKLLENDRGVFARVINSGSININDDIYILIPIKKINN